MAKQAAQTLDELETPDVINLDKKETNFGNALKSAQIPTAPAESAAAQLDLSEDEEDFLFIDKEPDLGRYVVAKYTGTTGSPDGSHVQTVNGQRAEFPLNRLVVVKYLFIKAARRSGYVDFVQNPGKKNMKKVDNLPAIAVQDVIPEEFQSDDKIMGYIDLIEATRGKRLLMACETL